MLKKLVWVVLILVVLVGGGLGYVVWNIDALTKRTLETGATDALGVQTTVENVKVSLLGGSLGVDGMTVVHPEGYSGTASMIRNRNFVINVETGSLFSDTVVVPLVTVDGLEIDIIQRGLGSQDNNVSAVLANMQTDARQEPAEKEPGGKKLRVDKLVLTNLTANVHTVGSPLTITIDRMELDNATSDEAQGVAMDEIMRRLFPAIMAKIVSDANFPADLAGRLVGDLGNTVGQLGEGAINLVGQVSGDAAKQITGVAEQVVGQIGEKVGEIGKDVGDKVGEIGKDIGDKAGEIGKDVGGKLGDGIGGILGGDKDKKDENQTDGEDDKPDDPLKKIGDLLPR